MHERLFENLKTWTPTTEETEGKHGIPKIEPCELPEIERWAPFNDLSRKIDKAEGLQMYVDDYRIGRLWQSPLRYIDGLRRAGAVLTPDYSIYTDVPSALGIYNHYRKHWLGAYWQQCGLTVIPTICWGGDETFDWCFDGEPHNAPVSVSSVGTQRKADTKSAFMRGYDSMLERLNPSLILFFGHVPAEARGNILHVDAFYHQFEQRRAKQHVDD